MIKNVLECLENSCKKNENKIIFADEKEEITYLGFLKNSQKIGTGLYNKSSNKRPIAIFIDKSINTLLAMFGVLYSGSFYTIIDVNSPIDRIKSIAKTLEVTEVITDEKNRSKIQNDNIFQNVYTVEELLKWKVDNDVISNVRENSIDTDLMYVLFTSGSTGVPKGVAICHRSVIDYISFIKNKFDINGNTIFGSGTQLYFSMSILDIYTNILAGSTLYLIPKIYFSFPIKLLEFMNQKKINTIYWVPSALGIISDLRALDDIDLPYLKKVLFAGEVMPVKKLNYLMIHLKNAMFANLYGPTEVTDICTYYIVDRKFKNDESLPIGVACDNCEVLVLKDDFTKANFGEEGQLCVKGSYLALGYYNNKEATKRAFIQNPLNLKFPEVIYLTGDIVKYNQRGELEYISRKDFQIKHMGYRIELGEIEKVTNSIEGIQSVACVYDFKKSRIVMFYTSSNVDEYILKNSLKEKLLDYMMPSKIIKLKVMPHNANGKIDRKKLKEMLEVK